MTDLTKRHYENEIEFRDLEIADLKERLSLALKMDEISKSQAHQTLICDVNDALRLYYEDWQKFTGREMDQDLYEARGAIGNNVFRALKRFGLVGK